MKRLPPVTKEPPTPPPRPDAREAHILMLQAIAKAKAAASVTPLKPSG